MGLETPQSTTTITPALTTAFVPAPSCFGSTVTLSPEGRDALISNTTNWLTVNWGVNTQCYPPNFWLINSTTSQSGTGYGYTGGNGVVTEVASYFSPGICPSGFENVVQTIVNYATSVTCCPSGLSLTDGASWCTVGQLNSAGITLTVVGNGSTTTSAAQYMDQRATPIVVQWESSDLSLFPAATATPSNAIATTSASSQSAAALPTNVAPAPPGLSEGAKAGIGVGAAVGGILLASALGYWLLRKKRRSKAGAKGDAKGDTENSPIIKAELPGEGVEKHELHGDDKKPHLEELGGGEVHEIESPVKAHEIESSTKPQEMDSLNIRAELEGDTHRHGAKSEVG